MDTFTEDRKVKIMGIVNLTDNSYFADSRCLGPDGTTDTSRVVGRVRQMIDDGADIVDIGACSTRPGSEGVGEKEEWKRLEPALGLLRETFPDISISIDTYWSGIVRKAYRLIGDFIVNDISAGEDDPGMLPAVGELGLTYIAMHKRGTPSTMQQMCTYGDVTEEVLDYFRGFAQKAAMAGIKDWILDPGFGFAKTIDQNYQLMRDLDRFSCLGKEILVGVSRKSMIFKLFGITPEESLPQTQVLHFAAIGKGAGILRVHDVAEAARTVELYRRLKSR